jgi:histidinol-phosphatase
VTAAGDRAGIDADLAFALSLADDADAVTLGRFRAADLHVETKVDRTPVSEADRLAERLLRQRLAAERPHERVLGEEEGGAEGGGTGGRWVLDPIDATKNYVRGIPVWATLLALDDRVAVVSAPALGRRWWAARGAGAWTRDLDGCVRRLRVSSVARVEEATLAYTSLEGWDARFHDLLAAAAAARGYGDFWQYVLLAEGAVDGCLERVAAEWDLAAPKLVVEEAGGRLTDLAGADRADGGSAVASNGLLHDELLATLAPGRR